MATRKHSKLAKDLAVIERANRAHICRSEILFGNFGLPFKKLS